MRNFAIFGFALIGIFIIDQGIKELFEAGYNWQSKCISLELHINHGVAFSMLSFLGANLKWVVLALVGVLAYLVVSEGWLTKYPFSLALLTGGALGNLYDRFIKGGVTDYVYWHCGFDFAVFNFADVAIDVGIALILLQELLKSRTKK